MPSLAHEPLHLGSHCQLCLSPSSHQFSSVQPLSHVLLFVTPWIAACQASLSITNSWSLLIFVSIESVMPSNYLILCHPLLLLTSIFPRIRVFSTESVIRIRWSKYWSFSISPFNEYSGLISFRMDWFDLLAVQGTLKSLLQHHSSKASILQCSAFFIVQLSHPYMTKPSWRSLASLEEIRSLWQRHGSAVACCRVGGTEYSVVCMGPFEGGSHYLHYLHHSLASGQTTGREHSPIHQQKIGLKIF